jgi:hypothetical protein
MSAEFLLAVRTNWYELLQFLAKENKWTEESSVSLATALGILLLCDMTLTPGVNLGKDFPEEVLIHLANEMIGRGWEKIGVSYALAGESGELD